MKEQKPFIIELQYNAVTDHYFIDFLDERGVVISCLVTAGVARGLSRSLDLKIIHGLHNLPKS